MNWVSAYVEINKDSNFHWGADEPFVEAEVLGKTPAGLEVEWRGDPPPDRAQVYLYWEPKVVAIWNEEEEIENGEDGNNEDDAVTGPGGEEVDPEPDQGSRPTGGDEMG